MTQESALTYTLLLAVLAASLGTWFPLGYNIVALNGPQMTIIHWIRNVRCSRMDAASNSTNLWCTKISAEGDTNILSMNPELNLIWTVASSITGFGGLISTIGCAPLVNRYGPKRSLFLTGATLTLGTLIFSLSVVAQSYEMLIGGRLVIGFGMGMICAITPIYTSELAPVSLRGAMGTINVIMSVMGMLAGTLFGLPQILGSGTDWAILVALQLIPVAVMCLVLFFCPDSPTYLYLVRQEKRQAMKALIWLRNNSDVNDELLALEAELKASKCRTQKTVFGIFQTPVLRLALIISVVPMFAQHFAGYGCVTMYSTAIFTGIGLTHLDGIYASMGLWLTYLVASLISMVLVDRMGRRTLLLVSHATVFVSFCLLVTFMALTRQHAYTWTKYGSAACLFLYIAFYAVGLASIPWILPSELFTQEARAAGMTVVCLVTWASVLITTFVFSVVLPYAQEYTFIVFIFFVVATGVFSYLKQPETKGKSIAEIQTLLRVSLQTVHGTG